MRDEPDYSPPRGLSITNSLVPSDRFHTTSTLFPLPLNGFPSASMPVTLQVVLVSTRSLSHYTFGS